ncbi:hypothetical protein R3P38DRAFT_3485352 [Favolaschia claudopus]|uniref:Protein YTP1-like C-terminal domain-containing protein n=1 Tax=Favolaschia claudopus TaxID=2862362 RepID=A0AAW0CCY8_9AGAR
MRFHPVHLALASSLFHSYAESSSFSTPDHALELITRSGGENGHHHGVAPLLELNETELLQHGHSPTPPSYYTIDWEDPDQTPGSRHPGLIITHSIFMSLAFFGFLPTGELTIHHAAYSQTRLAGSRRLRFLRLVYSRVYAGSSHARHGYTVFLVALVLTGIDAFNAFCRLVLFLRSEKHYTFKGIVRAVFGRDHNHQGKSLGAEYIGLMGDDGDAPEEGKQSRDSYDVPDSIHTSRSSSPHSEATLHDVRISSSRGSISCGISLLRRVGRGAFAATERALVIAGFAMLLSGIVIYTGGCREKYFTGCLAHLIKGGIFWCYGLISFARFLGWCSEVGWAWNSAAPSHSGYPTAEMVESTVIFLYGATNTWMERFGAKPGDPYTTKQIQHIGIAVMFWFAGLVGMAIESKTIRRWLTVYSDRPENISESHTPSFNPFPALVIGVTGSVMAAHFQVYLFQVQIHALWGNLLVAFAVLRSLTYFFLWVAPPRTTLPSRPPTEALGSFFLAAGGLSFMFSTEEVTIMAMRRGRDDIMMFAVVAVAITCLAFSWTVWVVGFHGWLKGRMKGANGRSISYNSHSA